MAKITREEAEAKTNAKINQIKDLANKLQISITAEQAIVKGNLIRPVVYFVDAEAYDIEKPAVVQRGPHVGPGMPVRPSISRPNITRPNISKKPDVPPTTPQ